MISSKRRAGVKAPVATTHSMENSESTPHQRQLRKRTKKQLTNALEAIQRNTSVHDAAEMFNIPIRTLHVHAARCGIKFQSSVISGKTWSEQQMTEALQAIRDGMSFRNAAATFNIPRATLQRHTKQCGIQCRNVKRWTKRDMANALAAVRDGMSLSKAASMFNIPHGTVHDNAKRCGIRPVKRMFVPVMSVSEGNRPNNRPIDAAVSNNDGGLQDSDAMAAVGSIKQETDNSA